MSDRHKDSRFEPSEWFRSGRSSKSETVRNLPHDRTRLVREGKAEEGAAGGAAAVGGPPPELDAQRAESKEPLEFGFTPAEIRTILAPYHDRADRLMMGALCVHLLLAFCLAPFYDSWAVAAPVGLAATGMFALSWALAPRTHFTRSMAGVALQTFVALHIYQMHGLPEMHFFFFTSFTLMVACFDWKAMWLGTTLIIGQHILFAVMTNLGVPDVYFFPEHYIEVSKLAFHFGIAIVHVGICGRWAYTSRRQVLLDARQRQDIARLALMARNTQNAVALVDATGRLVWANPAFFRQTGYHWEEIRGKELAAFLAGPDTDHVELLRMREAVIAGAPFEGELFQYTAAGQGYWVSRSLTPSFDRSSGLREYVVVDTDVSQQRRATAALLSAKEAAEAANRSKDYFLANVSHELRTPLNGVLGLLDALLADSPTRAQQDLMTIAREAAGSLNVLVDDLLDLAKIEAGKLELAPTPFSLDAEIGKTLRTLAGRAYDKGVELAYLPSPEVPSNVVGDPVRLRQVLTNLASNAVKFTEAGAVEVRVEAADRRAGEVQLRFAVVDTGIGIPNDKLEAIFAPFQQADASTTRKYGGTGLGLAIVRRLVELMGGEVVVRSRVGRGSEFSFAAWFPLAPHAVPRAPHAVVDAVRRRGGTVWIIEDHGPSRETWARWLRAEGIQTAAVETAAAAEGLARRAARAGRPPALVVVDDALFPASHDVWRELFTPGRGMRPPRVVRTVPPGLLRGSSPAAEVVSQVMLTKPFTPGDFWSALQAALEGDESEDFLEAAAPTPFVVDAAFAAPAGDEPPSSSVFRRSPALGESPQTNPPKDLQTLPPKGAQIDPRKDPPEAPSPSPVDAPADAPVEAPKEAPAAGETSPPAVAAAPHGGGPAGGSLAVLLVEDNRVNQLVARLALERAGHKVTLAENGADAVDLWRRRSFDVILMDVQMPVMDGVEATTLIRNQESRGGRRTPIVAMTARAMKGDADACLAAGMDAYLTKPLRWDQVRTALERLQNGGVEEGGEGGAPAVCVSAPPADEAPGVEPPGGDPSSTLAR